MATDASRIAGAKSLAMIRPRHLCVAIPEIDIADRDNSLQAQKWVLIFAKVLPMISSCHEIFRRSILW